MVDGAAVPRRAGLWLPEDLPLQKWRTIGQQIVLVVDSTAWWLGDWLAYGQDEYPDRYRRVLANSRLEFALADPKTWPDQSRPGR